MGPYLTAKWLHLLSSTVLFGTGLGTAFQMVWVMRTGTAGQIARTAAGVVRADRSFTTPAQAVQLYRIWFALGWPAFAPLVAVFWLMVSKPVFI